MAFQEEPPKIPNPWLWKMLKAWWEWLKLKQVFSSDGTVDCRETPRGIDLSVADDGAGALLPLTLIADNSDSGAPKLIVVTGGILWGGIFRYADNAMDPAANGTIAHPNFTLSGLADGDSVWIKGTLSFDGVFWQRDDSEIESGAVVPAPDATSDILLLGTVAVTDGVLSVTIPQAVIGNQNGRRLGLASSTQADYWPVRLLAT